MEERRREGKEREMRKRRRIDAETIKDIEIICMYLLTYRSMKIDVFD